MKTIPWILDPGLTANPENLAIITGQKQISYLDLQKKVLETELSLKSAKIQSHQHVALALSQNFEHILLILALWKLRAVACILNPQTPPKILNQQISFLNCHSVIVNGRKDLKTFLPKKNTLFTEEIFAHRAKIQTFEQNQNLHLSDPATIILTSASTGTPKAVVHTIANHFYNAIGSQSLIPLTTAHRWLLSLPLYHVSGVSILWRCFLNKASVQLPNPKEDFDKNIQEFKPTHVSMVTTQLYRCLNSPATIKTLKKSKVILLGGGPAPIALLTKAKKFQLPVYLTYGLTEMSSQVATKEATDPNQMELEILPYRKVKISKSGEILVKGKTLSPGYWQGHRMVRRLDSRGWLKTGDIGAKNENKLLIYGRKDRMFISGGENIYPEEIESALMQTRLFENCFVKANPHPEFGYRPIAYLKPFQNTSVNEQKIKNALRQLLPKFKIPDVFFAWPKENDIDSPLFKKLHRLADF